MNLVNQELLDQSDPYVTLSRSINDTPFEKIG